MTDRIELLSPAGDMEKLIMSLKYGADAVYLAGTSFGMRASAGNFNESELVSAVNLAHSTGAKVYVTCNTLPREHEISGLTDFLKFINTSGVDALIIADLGVLSLAEKFAPGVKIHISTQFGITNSETANLLYEMGADTAILARELSLEEIKRIRDNTNPAMRLEAFVHGAMCVSFSGRCLLSNYLTGRDANRGECAQPCRWKYHLVEEKRPGEFYEISEDTNGSYILNSNDMCLIEHIPELADAGIDSIKIEGRMKSSYYAAIVTNAYRHVLDDYYEGRPLNPVWKDETDMVSHRPYSTGFFYGNPGQCYSETSYYTGADIVAVIKECDNEGNALLIQRNKFCSGDLLELVSPGFLPEKFTAEKLYNFEHDEITDTRHAAMLFRMKLPRKAEEYSILRKPRTAI